ncbi:MAG: penicillin-binding transpeptidase domain-containing protein [Planctomycetota bacterium]|nr:penicillin-binding transpeptidase domain-containing protein [Planctomycetota bacterium]
MYATRLKAVMVVLGLGVFLLGGSLFYLQVFQGTWFREEAAGNLRRKPGFPPTVRGSIFDRNGLVLAQDTGGFDVAVYLPFIEMPDDFVAHMARQWRVPPEEVRGRVERMWAELARLTHVPPEELVRRTETIRARVEFIRQAVEKVHGRRIRIPEETYGEPSSAAHPIVYDVDLAAVGAITSRPEEFPGLVIESTRKREYPYSAVAPHITGRLGEVAPEELTGPLNAEHPPGDLRRYWPGDWIGRGGIEGGCEERLRGARGLIQKGIEGNLLEDIPPVPGQDVHLALDIALQSDVEEILDHPPAGVTIKRGCAAVVLDCRTGEALVLATAPRYDQRSFQANFADLLKDPARPLVNRAVSGLYPLGSVFKAVTTTAALHEGVITPQTVFTCEGVLDPAHPNRFGCDVFRSRGSVHGPLPLRTAIQKSCNVYFYHAAEALSRNEAGRLDLKAGSVRLQAWAARLGLGRPTGVGLGGEPAGNLSVGDPRNLAVGQGELLVTPLQVAQLYGLVATDGRMPPVRLIRDGEPAQRPPLGLNPRLMAVLRDGLTAVVNEQGGTGYATAYLPDIRFAGKTGTAQSGRSDPHAWFAGFAPAENPRVAFAVIVEYGGHGGTAAGPVAREIVKACQAHGYLADRPRSDTTADSPPNGKNGNGKPKNGKRNGVFEQHLPPASLDRAAPQPVG